MLLVHTAHLRAMQGRKTDEADARWLAKLIRNGLLTASFNPPRGSATSSI
jgi:hypothetical protein